LRKRLRKKKHIGEFQELGFQVEWRWSQPLDVDAFEQFWERFLALIEAKGLTFGGGSDAEHGSGFICSARPGSAEEQDRSEVKAWLLEQPHIAQVDVGPLEDAWHSSNRQYAQCERWLTREHNSTTEPGTVLRQERVMIPPVYGSRKYTAHIRCVRWY